MTHGDVNAAGRGPGLPTRDPSLALPIRKPHSPTQAESPNNLGPGERGVRLVTRASRVSREGNCYVLFDDGGTELARLPLAIVAEYAQIIGTARP